MALWYAAMAPITVYVTKVDRDFEVAFYICAYIEAEGGNCEKLW